MTIRSQAPTVPDVIVVGSCNVDLTVPVDQLPAAGETVLGGDYLRSCGGKGANQAVMSAALGRRVELVARIGEDAFGAMIREALVTAGVGTQHLQASHRPTGLALITVDTDGENTIAVSPGANDDLSIADVQAARALLATAPVTLLQLEVPTETVLAAAREARGLVVLDPAPARPLPSTLWEYVDIAIPNRAELAMLVGQPVPQQLEEVEALAHQLPAPAVIVTLGDQGALVVTGPRSIHIPAAAAEVVDATGAGDAFAGGLADALVRGLNLEDAATFAVQIASQATTVRGAQGAADRLTALRFDDP